MSAVLRLKMFANTVSESTSAYQEGEPKVSEVVRLHAVYSTKDDSPNKKWALATPSGVLEFTVDNPLAQKIIKPGKFFYVDIIPCEKDSP